VATRGPDLRLHGVPHAGARRLPEQPGGAARGDGPCRPQGRRARPAPRRGTGDRAGEDPRHDASRWERLGGQRERIREELARLDAEDSRLAGAIAAGGELAALLVALQERERRRQALRTELAALERATEGAGRFDVSRVLDALRGQLTDWQGMLRQEGTEARRALSALLAGRLIFTPKGEGGTRYYEFAGPGTLSKVIAGLPQ
jgi:hypothetical protein